MATLVERLHERANQLGFLSAHADELRLGPNQKAWYKEASEDVAESVVRIAALEEALRGLWDEIEHGTDLHAHFYKFECPDERCRIHTAFLLVNSENTASEAHVSVSPHSSEGFRCTCEKCLT